MSSIKVLIVDDHPVIRAGIKNLLKESPDIHVIGEAENGSEALDLIKDLAPDVLLLDMELPDIDGTTVARQLQEKGSPVRILFSFILCRDIMLFRRLWRRYVACNHTNDRKK